MLCAHPILNCSQDWRAGQAKPPTRFRSGPSPEQGTRGGGDEEPEEAGWLARGLSRQDGDDDVEVMGWAAPRSTCGRNRPVVAIVPNLRGAGNVRIKEAQMGRSLGGREESRESGPARARRDQAAFFGRRAFLSAAARCGEKKNYSSPSTATTSEWSTVWSMRAVDWLVVDGLGPV